MSTVRSILLSFLFVAPVAGESTPGSEGGAEALTLDDVFPSDRVVNVEITVAEEDWDTIRLQSRSFADAFVETRKHTPVPSPFTYVEASLSIDGVVFPKVGIRKKGFIGSLNAARPSLKVKLHHSDPNLHIGGLRSLTLNNNQQDISLVSQYLGYQIFNAAGSPAPRCAFAHVKVNGKDLGIYAHVESAKRPLLKRGFGNSSGTLYEGTVVDFYDGWEGSLERKLGDDVVGRAKIKELIEALSGGGGEILLAANSASRCHVPTSDELDGKWIDPGFDDSKWIEGKGGAGYETQSGYESHFAAAFDLEEALHGQEGSVYLRFPFELNDNFDLAAIVELTLRVKYDDGFVAYLNGHRIAAANAPETASWNATATGPNGDAGAVVLQPFDISPHIERLRHGRNVLAIQGLNVEPSSSDMLVVPELRWSASSSAGAVAEVVDLDAFYTYWALEGLLGFWDGYSGNKNNYFIYLNPISAKFHFLPWGADSLFERYSKLGRDPRAPLSVKTGGLLAHRLYQRDDGRARYLKTLQSILKNHWQEERLLQECDRAEALLGPFVDRGESQTHFYRGLDRVREFIRTRRQEIGAEIADGMPEWNRSPSEPPLFREEDRQRGFGFFGGGNRGRRRGNPAPRDDVWSAARRGDVTALTRHIGQGEDGRINRADGMGAAPLNWAAGFGRIEAVEFLLKRGADVNVRNRQGRTPLDDAEQQLDDDAARFLSGMFRMELKADEVNAAKPKIAEILRAHGGKRSSDLKTETHADAAPKETGKQDKRTTTTGDVWTAARAGDVELIKKLIAAGADLDARDTWGATATTWAARLGHADAVKVLIDKGADVNVRDNNGDTPLDHASSDLDADGAAFLRSLFSLEVDPQTVTAERKKVAALLRSAGRK